ncbi:MAG: hypothetical protein GX961_03445, partial [Firmicutes bacterium]|nr:hypothetical protein [Bacillota bacterium]
MGLGRRLLAQSLARQMVLGFLVVMTGFTLFGSGTLLILNQLDSGLDALRQQSEASVALARVEHALAVMAAHLHGGEASQAATGGNVAAVRAEADWFAREGLAVLAAF